MQSPRFVPEIQLGHLLQIGAMVVTIGSGIFTAYYALQGEIASTNNRVAVMETQAKSRTELDQQWRDSVKGYMRDTSTNLQSISHDITELKVQLARQSGGGRHE